MRTKKFQCATWLSIAHQCAHMRTLLDTLENTEAKKKKNELSTDFESMLLSCSTRAGQAETEDGRYG